MDWGHQVCPPEAGVWSLVRSVRHKFTLPFQVAVKKGETEFVDRPKAIVCVGSRPLPVEHAREKGACQCEVRQAEMPGAADVEALRARIRAAGLTVEAAPFTSENGRIRGEFRIGGR